MKKDKRYKAFKRILAVAEQGKIKSQCSYLNTNGDVCIIGSLMSLDLLKTLKSRGYNETYICELDRKYPRLIDDLGVSSEELSTMQQMNDDFNPNKAINYVKREIKKYDC